MSCDTACMLSTLLSHGTCNQRHESASLQMLQIWRILFATAQGPKNCNLALNTGSKSRSRSGPVFLHAAGQSTCHLQNSRVKPFVLHRAADKFYRFRCFGKCCHTTSDMFCCLCPACYMGFLKWLDHSMRNYTSRRSCYIKHVPT